MSIGNTIRKYRKALGMTQEQMATQLGVSAPAVNKWENGISHPDILLLAPLARLLKIDVNELLAFEEELTENEIALFINKLSENVIKNGIEEAFIEVFDKIKQFPNCFKLILWSAQVLNGYLVMKFQDISDKKKYEEQIMSWFKQVAFCDDIELAKLAQMSLAQSLIKEEKYKEAQKLLDKIPPIGFDKRIVQIQLYTEQEKYDDVFKALDSMFYQSANQIVSIIMQILSILCKQKEYEEALFYANIISEVSSIFDFGSFAGNSSYFIIYAEMGDKNLAIDALEKMMNSFETMKQAKSSKLYRHMKFNEDDGINKMKAVILKSFDNDSSFDFIRNEQKYKELYNKVIK